MESNFKRKKRYLIHKIEINVNETSKQFEIRLPSNVKKVSGVIVTATVKEFDG